MLFNAIHYRMQTDLQAKFVKLKVVNMLSQGELNKLLEHVSNLDGIEFSHECGVNTTIAKPTTKIDILNALNEVKKKVVPVEELFCDSD